jgi:hypothetical protein
MYTLLYDVVAHVTPELLVLKLFELVPCGLGRWGLYASCKGTASEYTVCTCRVLL